jgi:hypothetical protein
VRSFEPVWSVIEASHAWRVSELEVDNRPIATTRLPFVWQDFDNRRAAAFREKHRLLELIAPAKDDWEAILLLRHWAHTHLRDGNPGFVPPNPLALVDAAIAGATFWCTFYSYAFVAAANSVGIPARVLGIDCEHTAEEASTHHGISDAWSNSLRKWVAVDAHFDYHHELDGIPLNAEEVGSRWRTHQGEGIVARVGPGCRAVPRARRAVASKHETCAYFWHYIECDTDLLHQRNAPWPNPVVFPVDGERRRQTWYQGPAGKSYRHCRYDNGSFLMTERVADAYPDLNCTEISLAGPTGPYSCRVRFAGLVPNFSHYVAAVDGGAEIRIDGVEYPWRLHPGENSFEIRAVNLGGHKGPPSRVRIRIDEDRTRQPAWPAAPLA